MAKSKTAQRGKQSGAKGLHGRPAQRARAIEARQAAEAEERRRRIRSGLIFGTILVVALGAIAFGVGTSLSKKNDKPLPTAAVASGATAATMPPWAAPVDPVPGIELANLRSATTEAFAEHFHAHLDIKADGKAVAVPANLGLGAAQTGNVVSELHTHDALGIIHIEAPDKTRRYVLGQLFAEWGIRLDATHVGGFTAGAGKTLVGYIDGKKFDGNPAQIELKEHRQIALIFGTAEEQKDPPATFDWAAHKV